MKYQINILPRRAHMSYFKKNQKNKTENANLYCVTGAFLLPDKTIEGIDKKIPKNKNALSKYCTETLISEINWNQKSSDSDESETEIVEFNLEFCENYEKASEIVKLRQAFEKKGEDCIFSALILKIDCPKNQTNKIEKPKDMEAAKNYMKNHSIIQIIVPDNIPGTQTGQIFKDFGYKKLELDKNPVEKEDVQEKPSFCSIL